MPSEGSIQRAWEEAIGRRRIYLAGLRLAGMVQRLLHDFYQRPQHADIELGMVHGVHGPRACTYSSLPVDDSGGVPCIAEHALFRAHGPLLQSWCRFGAAAL